MLAGALYGVMMFWLVETSGIVPPATLSEPDLPAQVCAILGLLTGALLGSELFLHRKL